jgi:hypothetical protein
MILRALRLASLVLISVTALAAPAAAFTAGVWEGGPNRDESGAFTDCTMTAQAESGILLAFVISRDRAWGMALVDDRWSLQVGAVEDVTLEIDTSKPIKAIAKVVDPHGILVPLAKAKPMMEALQHGQTLAIVTPSDRLSFKLTGTREALAALGDCVGEQLRTETANGAPGNSAAAQVKSAPNKDQPNRLFSPEEAKNFAENLLAKAGITDYRLVDSTESPVANFDAVWTYPNGIIGALVGYIDMEAVELDAAANAVMADDAKICQGEFASGKKLTEPPDAPNVRRLFTSCHSNGKAIEIHYTLIKTGSGHLIEIAHLNKGDATGDLANADRAFTQGAVLESIK